MFAKPYKHKSNNTLKNSEKKHLAQRVQHEFSLTSEEKAKELIPVKSSCICMKIVVSSGDTVNVYAVDGSPVLIETNDVLVPTVCALWKVPDLVPVLSIHSQVFPKIQGGAPLYLPGINLPVGGVGFPIFQTGKVLAARTEDNAAACVVGRAAMSSADMLLRASGICLDTLHFYGDQLCKDNKFSKITRPKISPSNMSTDFTVNLAADVQQLTLQPPREEWPSLGKPAPSPAQTPVRLPATAPNEPKFIPEEPQVEASNLNEDADDSIMSETSEIEDDIPTDMDQLLRWCLLSFIKLEGKSIELPLKTNLLYKNYLHVLCPAGRTIDVKKSSYKKVSKFLEAMQQEGLVEVREVERGVDAVVRVEGGCAAVRAHRVPPALRLLAAPPDQKEYTPPRVREMFCVTAHVLPIFASLKKGTAVTAGDVRGAVGHYVAVNNLAPPQTRGAVTLDAALAKIVGKPPQESVKWDVLMSSVQSKMTPSTEMQFADGTVTLTKTKLEPIKMQVAMRSGNKKVTLVSNLESFGFNLAALSHVCQLGAAATCGVTRSPGARADQLMLQGDQTYFVAKLLIEKYGLPKKFVEGADKALNKKNK